MLIEGFEKYTIHRDGSIERDGKFLKPQLHSKGYQGVTLYPGANQFLLHRLMARAFIPNPLGLPQVNHLNGDKADNRVENLEWCSASDNLKHAYATGLKKSRTQVLTEWDIEEILRLSSLGLSCTHIARRFPVGRRQVNRIVLQRAS